LSLCLTNQALCHEDVWRNGYIDPCFLDRSTSWMWAVSFKPRSLYHCAKRPWYPLDRWLGGPQSWSGWCGEKKILDPTGTQNSYLSLVQPVASHYTDCGILAPINKIGTQIK
jgi:hypothetical protein